MESRVAIAPCADYHLEQVEAALDACLDPLGGIESFVQPGQKVLLKPNLLSAVGPETAIITHPAVIEAVVRAVQRAGGHPIIADSPGASIPYVKNGLQRLYRATKLLEVAKRTSAELNLAADVARVSHPEGVILKEFDIIRPVLDADVVISLPKLKTHMLTTFTGATKNLFGVIPGREKSRYHSRFPLLRHFADMLLDILSFVRPVLTIMDGIVGMEGNGPGTHGIPRRVGVLLASRDGIALDVVACRIIGLNPRRVPMLALAQARGWWDGDPDHIEVLGARLEEIAIADFKMPMITSTPVSWAVAGYHALLTPLLQSVLMPRPVPIEGKCTACGTCVRGCPREAISIVNGVARVNDTLCIRCYTCHEICPEAAIELRRGLLGRLIERLRGR